LKEVRRIILDCMKNIHPIYRIKELMLKRELAKAPKLVNESWDRFLPKFRQRHLKTSEKTTRKNEKMAEKNEARKAAGLDPINTAEKGKKVYTPFPPPQQPRKIDLQLESGEYFLKPYQKEAKEAQRRKAKQEEVTEKRRVERAEAFVPPMEDAAPTVEEKKKRKRKKEEGGVEGEKPRQRKKKKVVEVS